MPRCKAPEIPRNKAYLEGTSLTRNDLSGDLSGVALAETEALAKTEGNAADGLFSSA
jgi:hypothetical protein